MHLTAAVVTRYAALADRAAGAHARLAVELCIGVSQFLYCAGYPIFVAQNVSAAVGGRVGVPALLLLQLPLLVPYCWVRSIERLGVALLLANVCLWLPMAGVFCWVAVALAEDGPAEGVVMARGRAAPCILLLSQSVMTFEGIGLVLPIANSMETPSAYPRLLCVCMGAILVVYLVQGSLGYFVFGGPAGESRIPQPPSPDQEIDASRLAAGDVAVFETLDLPEGSTAVLAVQLVVPLSILLAYPLQLSPALALVEHHAFRALPCLHGTPDRAATAQRALRALVVAATLGFAYAAQNAYANLVGLAGGLCAVPLAFVLPGLIHLRLAPTPLAPAQRASDIFLVGFGACATVLCTAVALATWR
jgi:proton-coupled amino acid transporter